MYPNRTSALPRSCQLALWMYSIGVSTQLILFATKNSGRESVTKEKWWRILSAVWRNWKPCVFGIRVTGLLKNASKHEQNSRDWVWAHKVVTIIQTLTGGEGRERAAAAAAARRGGVETRYSAT